MYIIYFIFLLSWILIYDKTKENLKKILIYFPETEHFTTIKTKIKQSWRVWNQTKGQRLSLETVSIEKMNICNIERCFFFLIVSSIFSHFLHT